MPTFRVKSETESSIIALGEDCENYQLCKEIVDINNKAKLNKIKMIMFSVFGFILLIGLNVIVFLLAELSSLYIAIIVFDILAIALMIGIPIKEFIQTFFKLKNGTLTESDIGAIVKAFNKTNGD